MSNKAASLFGLRLGVSGGSPPDPGLVAALFVRVGLLMSTCLDHCLDSLRQTIMCHGDVTPISLHVNHISHIRAPRLNGTHQCRSFEKIREWGKARQAPVFELKHEGFLEHKPGEEG